MSAREYEETHPHISFQVDLRRASPGLWALLGEAGSKAQHVGDALLSPRASTELMQVYLAKGFLATTAIEGNTLSEEEVLRILEHQLELPPSREYLQREIENVLAAYNQAKDELLVDPELPLTVERLARFNELILDGLELEEGVVPGEIRSHSVVVGSYKAVPARDARFLLEKLCSWLNGPDFDAPTDAPELDRPFAIAKAIVAHLYLAWIHPFGDGNGRTARLLELQILLAAGFPVPTCQLLSNHYNQTRSDYYRQLTRSSRERDVSGFLHYAARGLVDQLREQLSVIWHQEFEDRWEQFVYQTFGERRSESDNRRLQLVLDVSRRVHTDQDAVRKSEITTLTPAACRRVRDQDEQDLDARSERNRGTGAPAPDTCWVRPHR